MPINTGGVEGWMVSIGETFDILSYFFLIGDTDGKGIIDTYTGIKFAIKFGNLFA
jgi:hypothetical protein